MHSVQLSEALFQGAVSLEKTKEGIRPWRIPFSEFDLFPPNGLNGKAEIPAGVRLAFLSDTTAVEVSVHFGGDELQLDCVVDNQVFSQQKLGAREQTCLFSGMGAGEKLIEIYLSQKVPVEVIGLAVDDASQVAPAPLDKPRWITYGSSITQCAAAESPAYTWPAIVSREAEWHLTCLGYGGNCHLEPMVARMIRDLPAEVISLSFGINVMGGATLSPRTFKAAIIGFIQILREKHVTTPIAVMSPIISPNREVNPNAVGFTLQKMREEVAQAVQVLQDHGDTQLFYVNGLDIFGEEYASYLPDQLHPNSEGYKIMANHFVEQVVPLLRK